MAIAKKLVTSKLGVTAAKNFADSFSSAENDYFMYFGKHVPYGTPFAYNETPGVGLFDGSAGIGLDNSTFSVQDIVFNPGDRIRYYTDTGITQINGLVNNQIYYVLTSSEDGIQLAINSTSTTAITVVPKSTSETHYFVYASGTPSVSVTGDVVEAPLDSDLYTDVHSYEDMIFAKRINSYDVSLMVDNNKWESGTVYAQYDNADSNLHLKQYFAISDDLTEYNVFKCLYNNNDAPSTIQPSRYGNNLDYRPFETSDGYMWKFMYTITKFDYEKFATSKYAPLTPNNHVIENAVPGTVDVVKVLNSGRGYNNWLSSVFKASDIRYLGSSTVYALDDSAANIDEYYQDCVIKITSSQSPGIVGQYRKIVSSVGNVTGNSKKYIVLDSAFTATPSVGDTYEIYPLVYIWGDGNETITASGRAIINSASSNSIHRVEILNSGKDYRIAQANLIIPTVISSDVGFKSAILEPVVAPKSGHGGDPYTELAAKQVGISVSVTQTESGTIPANNDFRTVGLIKNPEFNNVMLTHDSKLGTFTIGEEVVQYKNIKMYGTMATTAGSNSIYKAGNGQISSTITIVAAGTGYDSSINDALVFDNTNTHGSGAEGTFVSNTDFVTQLSFGTGNSAVTDNYIQVASNPLQNGDHVKYIANNAGLVGLSNTNYYYVVSSNATHFRLSPNNNVLNYKIVSNNIITTANATLAIVNGAIKTITVTNRGSGYITPPLVSINSEAVGSGTTLEATVSASEITSFVDSFDVGDIALLTDGTRNFVANVVQVIDDYSMNTDVPAVFNTDSGLLSKVQITARGIVESVSTNQMILRNVSGVFEPGKKILGLESYASASIDSNTNITINDRNAKGFSTATQLTTLVGSLMPGYTAPVEDEKIYQDSLIVYNQPSGHIHSYIANEGLNNDILYITREYGIFNMDPNGNRKIYTTTSESVFQVLNMYHGDFVKGTGDVLYIENLDPIQRNSNKSEIIKIVLEF